MFLSSLCVLLFISVSDADGQMRVTEVATRPLSQDLLNHDVSLCSAEPTKDVPVLKQPYHDALNVSGRSQKVVGSSKDLSLN